MNQRIVLQSKGLGLGQMNFMTGTLLSLAYLTFGLGAMSFVY